MISSDLNSKNTTPEIFAQLKRKIVNKTICSIQKEQKLFKATSLKFKKIGIEPIKVVVVQQKQDWP